MRPSGRKPDQLRAVSFERNYIKHAEGSCLVRFGDTHVLCTASLEARGEKQITLDCDVIQADGGTRTAAITGSWIALHDCLKWMEARAMFKTWPLKDHVGGVSRGRHG